MFCFFFSLTQNIKINFIAKKIKTKAEFKNIFEKNEIKKFIYSTTIDFYKLDKM